MGEGAVVGLAQKDLALPAKGPLLGKSESRTFAWLPKDQRPRETVAPSDSFGRPKNEGKRGPKGPMLEGNGAGRPSPPKGRGGMTHKPSQKGAVGSTLPQSVGDVLRSGFVLHPTMPAVAIFSPTAPPLPSHQPSPVFRLSTPPSAHKPTSPTQTTSLRLRHRPCRPSSAAAPPPSLPQRPLVEDLLAPAALVLPRLSPSTPAGPAAAAQPATSPRPARTRASRDLSAMLTPASFLIDATRRSSRRSAPRAALPRHVPRADPVRGVGGAHAAALQDQVNLAVLDARAQRHHAPRRGAPSGHHPRASTPPRNRRGAGGSATPPVLDLSHLDLKMLFAGAVLVSTLGSSPRAVAGSEELVLRSTLGLLELAMWSIFQHGDLQERPSGVGRKLVRDVGPPQAEGVAGRIVTRAS
ncbi:hypothetical protein HU200_005397 [Digitaria exilis]|uniref:Uncharacterized protein n=1 Tax=Digitaria exilis TaxID=1010633 RepID=A0A835FU49_9POAL|nr:hypothetical protein HU200_005397 [Digitaria exilis]